MSCTSSQFSRAAIIEWVNVILDTNYTNFAEVPAKDLALLLYGVYDASAQPQKISLHDIQFTSEVTPTILLHNAQHVLQLLKTLSEAEVREQQTTAKEYSSVPSAAVYKIDPNLSAADWLEGKAFVEELKMWRWLRTRADKFRVCPDAVRAAINAYLYGATTTAPLPARNADAAEGTAARCSRDSAKARGSRGDDHKRARRSASTAAEEKAARELQSGEKRRRKEEDRLPVFAPASADHQHRENAAAAASEDRDVYSSDEAIKEFEKENAAEVAKSEELYQQVAHTKKMLQELETRIAHTNSDEGCEPAGAENANPLMSSLYTDISTQKTHTCSHQCKNCPIIFAHMIQSSLDFVQKLEEQRKAALSACVKKDAAALITALQNIV